MVYISSGYNGELRKDIEEIKAIANKKAIKVNYRDKIEQLEKENKELKETISDISIKFLKYNWTESTPEQTYNQLEELYKSFFWEDRIMKTVYCGDISCKYCNEKNICTKKIIKLNYHGVHTAYEGYKDYLSCACYEENERYKELKEKLNKILGLNQFIQDFFKDKEEE